jgi:hypothetical protein
MDRSYAAGFTYRELRDHYVALIDARPIPDTKAGLIEALKGSEFDEHAFCYVREKVLHWLEKTFGKADVVGEPTWGSTIDAIFEWNLGEKSFKDAMDVVHGLYGYDVKEAQELVHVIHGSA